MPTMTPRDWSSSVVGVLSSRTAPPSGTQIRSVTVPPTSTPTRSLLTSAAPLCTQLLGRLGVDAQRQVGEGSGQHDAVVTGRALDAHVLVEHVVEHRLRVAVERVAPTAA